jgi:predicted aldo/keto reductase-like oxidoreductase
LQTANEKEVKAMKYSFKCPAPCNHQIKVDAQNDNEAVDKIMAAGKVHAKAAHPDMPQRSEKQMKDMLKAGMKKG